MGNYSDGERMYELARELFPVCRSITGEGTRTTLKFFLFFYWLRKDYMGVNAP